MAFDLKKISIDLSFDAKDVLIHQACHTQGNGGDEMNDIDKIVALSMTISWKGGSLSARRTEKTLRK